MKVSIFTSYTDPEKRMDPWEESLNCYRDFGDEIIITGQNWEYEFSFEQIGKVFQEGFDKCSGDWAIKMDIDTIFHENDYDKLRFYLKKYEDYPAICLVKNQIFTPDRYHTKARMCFILNKKKFPDIKLNGGGDLCDPTLKNIVLSERNVPSVDMSYWNYDSVFKTKEVISKDRARFARAWYRCFGDYGDRGAGDEAAAFNAWFSMIENRYKKHIFKLKIDDHPIYIKNKLQKIKYDKFGYDAFGLKSEIKRSSKDYYSAINERYISEFKLKLKNAKRYNTADTYIQ